MADKQTEDLLILAIKEKNCSESFMKLVDVCEDTYFSIVHKFCDKYPTADRQDLLDSIFIVFNKALISYNPKKTAKFNSWLYLIGRFYCLDSIFKKNNRLKSRTTSFAPDELNEISNFHHGQKPSNSSKEIAESVLEILDNLTDPRIGAIFRFRYLEGNKKNNWKDVSKKMGLSSNLCSQLEQRGKKILKAKLKYKNNIS